MAAKTSAAKKSTTKQSATKKPVAKKPAAKKTAVKKPVAKKPAAKKTAVKKPVAKKPVAKKPVAKKSVAKKSSAVKKTTAKKPTSDKAATKKSPARKSVAKKEAAAKKAPAKKSTTKLRSSAVFSKKFLENQRATLVEERARSVRQSRSLRDEAESLVEDFQSGDVQFDEESGEGDTLNVAREQDLMMSSQADSKVEEIDHALAKFGLDSYGICEISGEPIPEVRLDAIPWARERVECKVGGLTRR